MLLALRNMDISLNLYVIRAKRLPFKVIDVLLISVGNLKDSKVFFEVSWRIYDPKLHNIARFNDTQVRHLAFELHPAAEFEEILRLHLAGKV